MRLLLFQSHHHGPAKIDVQDSAPLDLDHHWPVVVDATERLIMPDIIDESDHIGWCNN